MATMTYNIIIKYMGICCRLFSKATSAYIKETKTGRKGTRVIYSKELGSLLLHVCVKLCIVLVRDVKLCESGKGAEIYYITISEEKKSRHWHRNGIGRY